MSGLIGAVASRSGILGRGADGSSFTACFAHGSSWHQYTHNQKIDFNDASTGHLHNNGNNFNTTTMSYVAPITGRYHFGWNIYTQWNDLSNAFELIVDGDRPLSANNTRGYYSLATEVSGTTDHFNNFDGIVELTAGNAVWVESHYTSDVHANLSIFYGYQLT